MAAPFVEALAPWLAAAEARLVATRADLDRVVTPSARRQVVEDLAEELAFVSSPTLLDRFGARPSRHSFSPHSSVEHAQFVEDLRGGTLRDLLDELPELERLLDEVTEAWCARTIDLLARLDGDRHDLCVRFGATLPVQHAEPTIGGSFVLMGPSGPRFVYKHRPVVMDAAFSELLHRVNEHADRYELLATGVIDRGKYGWTTHIPRRSTHTPAQRDAYLYRTGMLLCLAHLLGAGDLHAGNVRAFGEHPVILDAEVLLRPRRAGSDLRTASVLATGWLPQPGFGEMAGIACEHYDRPSDWVDVGSDAVRPRPVTPWRTRLRRASASDLREDLPRVIDLVSEGFTATYRLVLERGLPLEVFEGTRPRVLLRSSRSYGGAMRRSVQPSRLVSHSRREELIADFVKSVPVALADHPRAARAVRGVEGSALGRLEYPRFVMPAAGGPLMCHDDLLGCPFVEAPLARARRFVSAMSRTAMEVNCRDIAASLASAGQGPFDALHAAFELGSSATN